MSIYEHIFVIDIDIDNMNFWHLPIKYTNFQKSIISFGYVDF